MSALRISLLGQFQVADERGRQAHGFRSSRAQALLAYLAVEGDRPHRREVLMALLWPEEPDSVGRANLRTALFNLRQAIADAGASPPYLLITPETLSINPASDHWLDMAQFSSAMDATKSHSHVALATCRHCMGLLADAAARYRGDFLAGFSLPDCQEFEEWAAMHRERLQRQALAALDSLAAYHERRGELNRALDYARRRLGLDPWHEETHRQVMRLLARKGEREAALAQYESCRRVLAEELGLEPSAETAGLAAQIRAGTLDQSAGARLYNLAAPTSALLGRETELAQLAATLATTGMRLLTLAGPPGIGKTRLAEEVAARQADDYVDGVCYVELAPLRDPQLVLPTIAAALGIQDRGGRPIQESLHEHLRDKQLLLFLDNFEHLLPATPVVAALLGTAAQVQVLATSRAALRVAGEHEFPVPPLAVPAPDLIAGATPDPTALGGYAAVQLFVERARAIQPNFALTAANGRAVAAICARLDGLPLAIELAAARIRVFGPAALLARLNQRLTVLTGGPRERDPRQQTLRNTIEWSYDLLSDGEKQLFGRMAVFQGGRTLEALEAVCNADGQLKLDVLEGVESLLSQSLLQQREGADGEPRFWMLETIHEFAWEKLKESGEAAALQREHALYFMRLAEEAEPHLKKSEWLDRLGDEYDNIRAALRWASEPAQAEAAEEAEDVGLRLAGAMLWFWRVRGPISEGRAHLQRSLSISAVAKSEATAPEHPVSPRSAIRSKAKALNVASHLASRQADYASAGYLAEAALALGKELEDKQSMAFSLWNLAGVAQFQGTFAVARALHEESLALRREIGDRAGSASSLYDLGLVTLQQGDYPAARALFEESLTLRREIGDRTAIAYSLNGLGLVALQQGDYPAARALFEESLVLSKEVGDTTAIAYALNGLGRVALQQGDYPAARALLQESLALLREIGDRMGIANSLNRLGSVALAQRDYSAARVLFEEGLALSKELGIRGIVAASLHRLGRVALQQRDYPAARAQFEESLALLRAIGNTQGIASCLAGLGEVAVSGEAGVVGVGQELQVERGARMLGAVEGLLQRMGGVLNPFDREPYARSVQEARAQLGEVAFEKAWQEGRAMSMEQALAYALEREESSQ